MKQVLNHSIENEDSKPQAFHSDLNEFMETIHLIYKSREGIIQPKFGFCKNMINSFNQINHPFTIQSLQNEVRGFKK
jgi:hypothetical protein